MKKKLMMMAAVLFVTTVTFAANGTANTDVNGVNGVENINGGVITYEGAIGPYQVEFSYMNLHMGNGIEFYYTYKTIRVNKGEPIELVYQRDKGRYSVYYEYINGKHTGTFTIIRTKNRITGTFRNSKGKTYQVNAKMVSSTWVDE